MLERLFSLLLRLRWPVTLLIVLLTGFFMWQLSTLRVGQDLQGDLPPDDPQVAYYDAHIARFGQAEMLLVVVEGEIFTTDGLGYLQTLSTELAKLEHVEQVTSLATVELIAEVDGQPRPVPFMPDVPGADELPAFRERALAHPDLAGKLLSPDGQVASIVLQLEPEGDLQTFRVEMAERVDEALQPLDRDGFALHVAGVGPLLRDFKLYIMRDARSLMMLTLLVVVLLLAFVTRSIGGVVLPIIIIGLSVIWTMGTLAALGKPMGMAMVMVPTLIAVICLADSIHIMAHFQEQGAGESEPRSVIPRVFAYMAGVCLLTSVTTSVGFGSLAASGQASLRDLGLTAAVGILYGYLISMTLLPALLSWGWLRTKPADAHGDQAPDFLTGPLERLVRLHGQNRPLLVVISLLLIAACVALIPRLQVRTDMAGFLPDSAPSVQALNLIDGRIAGIRSLEMAVEGDLDAISDPAALAGIRAIQARLEQIDGVDSTNSIADIVARIHYYQSGAAAQADEPAARPPLPTDRADIEQYLDMVASSQNHAILESMLTPDWDAARITARIQNIDSARQLAILNEVEAAAPDLLPPGLTLRTTGIPKLYGARVASLVHGQKVSLLITALVSVVLLVLYFRSLRVGLVAIIPNILPVLLTLAVMVIFGIALNLVTMMTACIAIGLAVDDTLHVLVRYLRERRGGADMTEAMTRMIHHAGRPVLFTSLVIGGGFAILMASAFPPNRQFGFLSALTMLTAVLADLLVLPALIRIAKLK